MSFLPDCRCFCCHRDHLIQTIVVSLCFIGLFFYTSLNYINHIKIFKVLQFFEWEGHYLQASERELAMYRDLLSTFDGIARVNNISYFLYGGSLIGFQRNRTMLPWDDDMDVSMAWEDYEPFVNTLKNMTNYGMYRHGGGDNYLFKIYSKTFYSVYNKDRNYPFLDIFMYKTGKKGKYLWIGGYWYTKDRVFPARKGQFLGLDVPVPKDVKHVLVNTYGRDVFNVCKSNYNDHRKTAHLSVHTIDCKKLQYVFNFRKSNETMKKRTKLFKSQAERFG